MFFFGKCVCVWFRCIFSAWNKCSWQLVIRIGQLLRVTHIGIKLSECLKIETQFLSLSILLLTINRSERMFQTE